MTDDAKPQAGEGRDMLRCPLETQFWHQQSYDRRAEPAAPPRNAPLTEEMYPWLTAPPRAEGMFLGTTEQAAEAWRQHDERFTATIAELRVEASQSHRYTEQIVAAHDKLEAENARLVALIGRCRTLARATGNMAHVCDAMDEILAEIDALAAEGEK